MRGLRTWRPERRLGAVITAAVIAGGLVVGTVSVAHAAGPNYATSTEQFQLYYDGYVQVQASYSDSGRHAKNGWLRYYIPTFWDTGRIYTPNTTSSTSTNVQSRSYRFQDSINWSLPSTQFSYGFNWW